MDDRVSLVMGFGMNRNLNEPSVGSFMTLFAGLQNIVFMNRGFFVVLLVNVMELT